jgi:hypothetical protein
LGNAACGGSRSRRVGLTACGSAAPMEFCSRSAEPVRVRCSRVLAQRHPGECRLPDRSGVRRAETPG